MQPKTPRKYSDAPAPAITISSVHLVANGEEQAEPLCLWLRQCIDLFVEHLRSERNASANTVQSYVLDLMGFSRFVDNICDVRSKCDATNYAMPRQCYVTSEKCMTDYLALLSRLQIKPSSVKRKLSTLRQFFKFLHQEEIIVSNPMKFIHQPRCGRPLPKIIDEDTVKKMLHALGKFPHEERIRTELMLCLLYGSGLRVSELIAIRKNAIANARFIKIFGKGNKERIVPMASRLQSLLLEWNGLNPSSVWLFPSVDERKHITRQRVFQIVKQVASHANVDVSKISPHVLRHAFATHILDNGADLLSLMKMLGHSSISTTEIYTHVTRKKLKNVVNEFHPLAQCSDATTQNRNVSRETQK
ncbi:MAG: tyrosine-type recombinase/integrase [Holosporaceae bacterium]|jgi:integrase/recombinase XerD|nr:tyrosine-type recombinase/integrase [Holosporaceae bacterium]